MCEGSYTLQQYIYIQRMAKTYRDSICRGHYMWRKEQKLSVSLLALFPCLLTEQLLTLVQSGLLFNLASVLTVSTHIFKPLRYRLFIMSTVGYTLELKRTWYMCI